MGVARRDGGHSHRKSGIAGGVRVVTTEMDHGNRYNVTITP